MNFAPTFFDTLYPGTGSAAGVDLGYVAVYTHPDAVPDPTVSVVPQFFSWPSQREALIAFCIENADVDLYTTTALFSEPMARPRNIAHQWAVAIDAQDMDLGRLLCEPTLIVETGDKRNQLYWITDTDSAQECLNLARTIAGHHGPHGADTASWDALTLLRVPGSSDTSTGAEIRLVGRGAQVTTAHLGSVYPSADTTPTAFEPVPARRVWYYSGASVKESDHLLRIHTHLREMVKLTCDEDEKVELLWRLLSSLSRCAVTKTTAMHIAYEAKCNYFKGQENGESLLWEELCRAYADPSNAAVTNSLSADTKTENPEQRAIEQAEVVSFLTAAERESLRDDTFIDRYVAWAKQQTDAPQQYHRAGAAMILSSVFGEFGTCPTRTKNNLCLWFLILGPTTWGRKTTSMNLWVDMLADLETNRFTYLLTSDTTPEGLINALMPRDGMVSVMYRDEVDGLLKEEKDKHYMSGGQELRTELFNGSVRMRTRASDGPITIDERKPRVTTVFNLFQCGTTEKVAKLLTVEDYQSGHMTRFLCAYANPPMPTAEQMYLDLSGGEYDGDETDPERDALLAELENSREYWSEERGIVRGRPMKISFPKDVEVRWNEFQYMLVKSAEDSMLKGVLSPTANRMGISTMKVAALLAMADRESQVSMEHLLKAMSLAEEWYASTVIVAGKIEASSWYEHQEQILSAIQSKTDGVTQSEIFTRFCNRMTIEEIEKAIKALEKRGDIKIRETNKRVRLTANRR